MSRSSGSSAHTEDLIRDLQRQISALTLRVDTLEAVVGANQAEDSASTFEVVSPAAAGYGESAEPEAGEFGGPYSWTFRESVAKEIGEFIKRALSGANRGSSGREKLQQLASRYYIVVRDFAGNTYRNPVKVLSRFKDVKALCQRDGDWGGSVFVGVPSKREGSIAVRTAELDWPSRIQ